MAEAVPIWKKARRPHERYAGGRYAKEQQFTGSIFDTGAETEDPVTLFLVNGFQLRGLITGFDCFVVVLDSEGRQQIIYKHAISTIVPGRAVDFREEDESCLPSRE